MNDAEGPRQLWWRLLRVPLILFVLSAALFSFSLLDVDIAHALFFDGASGRWIGARSLLTNEIVHTGGQWLLRLIALAALIVWGLSFYKPRWREWRRPAGYLVLALLLSIGTVGLLKTATNVHCPRALSEFGGEMPYVHLFSPRPEGMKHGQCFPAAHASSGYALLAFWFVFRERNRRWARLGLATGILGGLIFGIAQQSRGAHFVSHDIWSAFLVWAISLTLYTVGFKARLWPRTAC
ncbi:phosphatase PAP2 family protein [Peristeroidobacter soli]|uniref:phosphatase PAP2 family protein n=1 Tax=Peristeroidobacter soli TaxID=2497877 RepID=UPI0013009B57|nr:phosphatase PAP2 family protein [Peristeroidobacter soli]